MDNEQCIEERCFGRVFLGADIMKLRQKAVLVIFTMTCILFAAFFVTSRVLVLSGFMSVERTEANEEMHRALFAVHTEVNELENFETDYAVWNDTYRFVVAPHPGGVESTPYIQSNFVDETYTSLRINLVAMYNSDGSLVYGKMYISKLGQQPLPSSIRSLVTAPRFNLLIHTGPKDWREGIIMLPQGPMLVASEPIVTSNMQGPLHGSMIFGRFLDSTELTLLSQQSGLSLERLPLTNMPSVNGTVTLAQNIKVPFSVVDTNEEQLSAYAEYPDISGQPAFVMKLTEQRTIYSKGIELLRYFEIFLFILSFVYGICTLLFLDLTVLRRVRRFVEQIQKIDHELDDKAVVNIDGTDELGQLQRTFNGLMVRLRASRKRIWQQANHDSLTGLANRNKFYILMEDALSSTDRGRHGFAILFIDIDRFKQINDKYGHDVGDMLLCAIAKRLEEAVGHHGVAVRLGGDEFLALWWDSKTKQDAESARGHVHGMMKEPYRLRDDLVFQIGTSVGVSLYPEDGIELEMLLKKADRDMYKRKHAHYI